VTTTNNPYVLEVSEAGLYAGFALTGGGCAGTSFTGSATITVNPLPTATMTDGNVQIVIDPGETADLPVELTGSSPWTFTYTVEDLDQVTISDISEGLYNLITSKTGTYEVKEVIDSKCPSNVSFGYPEVVLNSSSPAPTSHIDDEELFICPGEYAPILVHFTGSAPWTFTYMVDSMTTTIYSTYTNPYIINAIHEGTYEVIELADKYGDGSDLSGSAVVSYNTVPLSDFGYIADNFELSLFNLSENADYFHWDFGDGYTSTEENPVHIYSLSGIYQVSLSTASEQCTGSTLSRTITLTATPVIDTTAPSIKIYPNPSSGMVTIEVGNIDTESLLEIISLNGSILYSEIFPEGLSIKEIDLGYLTPGVYFVKISSEDQIITKKLIINNSQH
jgi:hypothetical protein